jgi:gamma-glutamyltranspeptidase/glutathione hydrolase
MRRPTTSGGDDLGVVAAGDAVSAEYGAAALRAGGNAVDAVLGALLASFTCEPALTGLGGGGYMLVLVPGQAPVLLDFFVNAPGLASPGAAATPVRPMDAVEVSFGEALQVFHGGAPSAGVYGVPAGVAAASARFGRLPLAQLAAPAARLAREGARLSAAQAQVLQIVSGLALLTPESRALFAPQGKLLGAGERFCDPALGDSLELLGSAGAAPFYTGSVGEAVAAWVREQGGTLSREDLAAYRVIEREPLHVGFRGREVFTNPPPAAGGILLAHALCQLDTAPAPLSARMIVRSMERVQELRGGDFAERLGEAGFAERFLRLGAEDRLGSTTHVAALDRDGMACTMTTSNGSSSGAVVPRTGLHLNNMLGESDLNPAGFHRHQPGERLPSMMSPTVLLRDGAPELVLGSAGSNRIRSAVLQTILRTIDDGMTAEQAVVAPRLHYEDGAIYVEPGVDLAELDLSRYEVVRFERLNLYFGGVQAVQRDPDGRFCGGGDPRRGGAAVVVTTA